MPDFSRSGASRGLVTRWGLLRGQSFPEAGELKCQATQAFLGTWVRRFLALLEPAATRFWPELDDSKYSKF